MQTYSLNTVLNYIKSQEIIRVFINMCPGFGDQIANVHLMSKLNDAGFNGVFQVIYEVEAFQKIEALYDIKGQLRHDKPLEYADGSIQFIPFNYFNSNRLSFKEVDFAFTAFNDVNYFPLDPAAIFRSNKFIWVGVHETDTYKKYQIHIIQQEDKSGSYENAPDKLIYPVTSALQPEIDSLAQTPSSHRAMPALLPLLKAKNEKHIQTFSIYGMNQNFHVNINPSISILTILEGVHQYQQFSSKPNQPLVVIFHNDFHDYTWRAIQSYFNSNASISLASRTQFASITEEINFIALKPNSIVMLKVGKLPSRIFEPLFISSDYPPVYEGLSSYSLLMNAKVPSLYCNSSNDTRTTTLFPHGGEYFEALSQATCYRYDIPDAQQRLPSQISKFFFELENSESHASKMFEKLFAEYNSDRDKFYFLIYQAILAAAETPPSTAMSLSDYQQVRNAILNQDDQQFTALLDTMTSLGRSPDMSLPDLGIVAYQEMRIDYMSHLLNTGGSKLAFFKPHEIPTLFLFNKVCFRAYRPSLIQARHNPLSCLVNLEEVLAAYNNCRNHIQRGNSFEGEAALMATLWSQTFLLSSSTSQLANVSHQVRYNGANIVHVAILAQDYSTLARLSEIRPDLIQNALQYFAFCMGSPEIIRKLQEMDYFDPTLYIEMALKCQNDQMVIALLNEQSNKISHLGLEILKLIIRNTDGPIISLIAKHSPHACHLSLLRAAILSRNLNYITTAYSLRNCSFALNTNLQSINTTFPVISEAHEPALIQYLLNYTLTDEHCRHLLADPYFMEHTVDAFEFYGFNMSKILYEKCHVSLPPSNHFAIETQAAGTNLNKTVHINTHQLKKSFSSGMLKGMLSELLSLTNLNERQKKYVLITAIAYYQFSTESFNTALIQTILFSGSELFLGTTDKHIAIAMTLGSNIIPMLFEPENWIEHGLNGLGTLASSTAGSFLGRKAIAVAQSTTTGIYNYACSLFYNAPSGSQNIPQNQNNPNFDLSR